MGFPKLHIDRLISNQVQECTYDEKPTPEKHCQHRKRWIEADGNRLESMNEFKKRRFCSIRCYGVDDSSAGTSQNTLPEQEQSNETRQDSEQSEIKPTP